MATEKYIKYTGDDTIVLSCDPVVNRPRMKYSKIICLVFLGLFFVSLFYIWFAASETINSGLDRPQWEENLTVWHYFIAWGCLSLIINGFLCFVTLGLYSIIVWAFRLRRRAIVNRA